MSLFRVLSFNLLIAVALVWGLVFPLVIQADSAATIVNVVPSSSGGGSGGTTVIQQPFIPVVFQFEVIDSTENSITISWRTNGLSQASLVYRQVNSDQSFEIDATQEYKLEHYYTLNNLESGGEYELKINAYTTYSQYYESEWITISTLEDTTLIIPNVEIFNYNFLVEKVRLFWELPPDESVIGIRLVRSTVDYPKTPNDGVSVCQGYFFECFDVYPTEGEEVFYTLFVYDEYNNFSSGSILSIFLPELETHVDDLELGELPNSQDLSIPISVNDQNQDQGSQQDSESQLMESDSSSKLIPDILDSLLLKVELDLSFSQKQKYFQDKEGVFIVDPQEILRFSFFESGGLNIQRGYFFFNGSVYLLTVDDKGRYSLGLVAPHNPGEYEGIIEVHHGSQITRQVIHIRVIELDTVIDNGDILEISDGFVGFNDIFLNFRHSLMNFWSYIFILVFRIF